MLPNKSKGVFQIKTQKKKKKKNNNNNNNNNNTMNTNIRKQGKA